METIAGTGIRINEAVAVGNMAEDLTGRRFGNLTAVRRAENRYRRALMRKR